MGLASMSASSGRGPLGLLSLALAVAVFGCDAGQTSNATGGGGQGGAAGGGQGGAQASTGAQATGSQGVGAGGVGGMGGMGTTSSSGSGSSASSSSGGPPPSNGYWVEGNVIRDQNGAAHVFRGIARPSHEWNAAGENISLGDFQKLASWGANVTRLSLNQGFWLPGHVRYDASYQANIDKAIQWAHEAGLDVVLDLHWSDKGNKSEWNVAQQRMADKNSIEFWQSVATKYKNDPRVLFELYNEPKDIPWNVWKSGGDSGEGWQAVGMQQLYDTVRATGAENLVLVGGLDWAFDLSGVPANKIQGMNIVYVTHPYDFANKGASTWDQKFGFLAATDPVFLSEFGSFDCSTNYTSQLLAYAKNKGISWTGWAWYPGGCGFPALINDWNGNPSAAGQVVKTALQSP